MGWKKASGALAKFLNSPEAEHRGCCQKSVPRCTDRAY